MQYQQTTLPKPKEPRRVVRVNMLRWTKHQLDAIVADTGMPIGIAMGAIVHCWAMAPEKARIAAEVEAAMVELAAEKQRERDRVRAARYAQAVVRGVRTDTGRGCE